MLCLPLLSHRRCKLSPCGEKLTSGQLERRKRKCRSLSETAGWTVLCMNTEIRAEALSQRLPSNVSSSKTLREHTVNPLILNSSVPCLCPDIVWLYYLHSSCALPHSDKVTWIYRIKIIHYPCTGTADSACSPAKSTLTCNPNTADRWCPTFYWLPPFSITAPYYSEDPCLYTVALLDFRLIVHYFAYTCHNREKDVVMKFRCVIPKWTLL